MILGREHAAVLDYLKRRKVAGSRDDGCKIGLVVEGGAMRGVYTSGALLGLDIMGFHDVFDVIYGTSAGAINAAHFLSREGTHKAATYYRALIDGRFFNPMRVWNLVDVDYFMEYVLGELYPLEIHLAQQATTPLYVAVLNFSDARADYFSIQEAGEQVWSLLKAAVAMPVAYRKSVWYNGHRYLDAGLAAPYALERAISDGCTHILVLTTRDIASPPKKRAPIDRHLYRALFAGSRVAMMDIYDGLQSLMSRLDSVASGSCGNAVAIATFSPNPQHVSSTCQDGKLLRDGTLQMCTEMLQAFNHPLDELRMLEKTGAV